MKQFARNGGFTKFQLNKKENVLRVDSIITTQNNLSGSLTGYVSGSNLSSNQIAYYSVSGLTGSTNLVYGVSGVTGSKFYVSNTGSPVSNELISKSYADTQYSNTAHTHSYSGSSVGTGSTSGVAIWSTSSSISSYNTFVHDWNLGSVKIGKNNVSSASGSVAVGYSSTASGNQAVAMGLNCVATGHQGIALGSDTVASGEGAIATGYSVTASGQGSVSLGYRNIASAQGSIALGYRSRANRQGQVSIADAGIGGVVGSSQMFIIVQNCVTSGNTPTILDTESKGYTLLLENDRLYNIMIQVVAQSQTSTTYSGMWTFRAGVRRRSAANTTLVVVNQKFADLVPSGWDCNISADTTNGALNITGTGNTGMTVYWTATLYVTEVAI